MQATGIILAGGQSSRMGKNKALLKIDGVTVIERIIKELKKVFTELIIVTNSFEEYKFLNLPLVEDKWKGMGPLAGIHAGLSHSQNEKNLVVACDMPFISVKLGEILIKDLDTYQAAVPEIDGQLHPLFAAYRKEVFHTTERMLKEENLRIRGMLDFINAKIVREADLNNQGIIFKETNFYNMNVPDEYKRALNISANQLEEM